MAGTLVRHPQETQSFATQYLQDNDENVYYIRQKLTSRHHPPTPYMTYTVDKSVAARSSMFITTS